MRKLIIISDLHLASGVLNDFDSEIEVHFLSFINTLIKSSQPVELIFNGDFLDFVQSEPWQGKELRGYSSEGVPLCYTEEQSIEKLNNIISEHKPIFDGLNLFLKSNSRNSLTIIPGNHDVDFFWPKVQELFKLQLLLNISSSPINIFLDQKYFPEKFKNILIEHGHQYDPCNSFIINGKPFWSKKSPPILMDTNGEKRLIECIGTRFLNKYINYIDEEYPFVDNIKPFSKFLLLFGASAFVPGYGPYKITFAFWKMFNFLYSTILKDKKDILAHDDRDFLDPRPFLMRIISTLNQTEQLKLINRLNKVGANISNSLLMFAEDFDNACLLMDYLSNYTDFVEDSYDKNQSFLSSDNSNFLGLSKGFLDNENEILISAARNLIIKNSAKHVVMGHTHTPYIGRNDLMYFNTGSWTKFFHFNDSNRLRPWHFLTTQFDEDALYQLNYVEVDLQKSQYPRLITYMEK